MPSACADRSGKSYLRRRRRASSRPQSTQRGRLELGVILLDDHVIVIFGWTCGSYLRMNMWLLSPNEHVLVISGWTSVHSSFVFIGLVFIYNESIFSLALFCILNNRMLSESVGLSPRHRKLVANMLAHRKVDDKH